MRTALYPVILLFTLLIAFAASAQDFSNKGKDFWIGYGYHVQMSKSTGPAESMQLYITSDVSTTGKVEIPGLSWTQSFSVTANKITAIDIPRSAALTGEGLYDLGIHVTSTLPVVVYSFIYFSAVSGATLCLPTNTLGRDYYSVNYTQTSNEVNSNSYFFVLAADTGTTSVEITPSAPTVGGRAANTPFLVNLTQGQIYQVKGTVTGNSGVDLTGSHIRSINTGSGCKKIAVFCGSGKIKIGTGGYATSDNLYQQMYPTATWGKKFIAVPALVNVYNYFRIIKSDPTATVTLNGKLVPASSFVNNFYYEYGSNTPSVVESDKPILVAQYFTTEGNNGNPSPGDPEMIYLNPVEQTISNVTLNSMQPATNTRITSHYLNVVLKNNPAAINTFKIDGVSYASSFVPVPADNQYAYLRVPTVMGPHTLTCDTGFNVICYGFGDPESYGYAGGTNLKDLYQFISMRNEYAIVDYPASCINTPFHFAMTFPYQPTRLQWSFNGLFADTTVDAPRFDSTWVVNGRQLYQYRLPSLYSVSATGTYPIRVFAQNPTADGCTGEQEIDFDLNIYDRPKADFIASSANCLSDTVHFSANSNTSGRQAYRWLWNFGDGSTANTPNADYRFKNKGNYSVSYSLITDIGCLSDTVSKVISIYPEPVAQFGAAAPFCIGKPVSFADSSRAEDGIRQWLWNFGDGTPVVTAADGSTQTHAFAAKGSFIPSLQVESIHGCKSTVYSRPLAVSVNPVAGFSFDKACLPAADLKLSSTSYINDNTLSGLQYHWDFGDGSTGSDVSPVHRFTSTGPFTVSLLVTSDAGCTSDSSAVVNTIYEQPKAAFTVDAVETCLGGAFAFSDKSSTARSNLDKWQWVLGDDSLSSLQNPSITYASAGQKTVKLVVTSAVGCVSDTAAQVLTVNPLPTAGFSFSGPDCVDRAIAFTDQSAANAGNLIKWSWDFGDGQTLVQNSPTPASHLFSQARTYPVGLQVETDKGCKSLPVSQPLKVSPVPQAGFIVPGSCLTDPYSEFLDSSKIADGSQSAFAYIWNFGDKNAGPGNLNTSSLPNPRHKYTATDTFFVSQTVISNAGCRDSVTHQFTINGIKPVSAFSITTGPELCSNEDLKIVNRSSVDFGSIVRLDIVWDSLAVPSVQTIDNAPVPGRIYGHRYPEFFSPASRIDSVYVRAYSGVTCFDGSWQPITFKATPELSFSPLDPVCGNAHSFVLTQGGLANGLPGKGLYSGFGVRADSIFYPSVAPVGVDTLTYTYSAGNGCSNSVSNTIKVMQVPTADAGPDAYVLEEVGITLHGSGSGRNLSYLWSPNIFLNRPDSSDVKALPQDDMVYKLTVTSDEGCQASDEVMLTVLKRLHIPNAFSPNGDGIHDLWEVNYLARYPGATVEIYNRYGQLVYRSNGYGKPWDGTYNGNALPVGTYYYIINPKNGRQQMSGFVDIIR